MTLKILALDISSTHIGLCYDGQPLDTWALAAKLNIAERCRLAASMVRSQLYLTPDIDLVVMEEPVARFAKALIPQAHMQGAVLCVLSEKQIAWTKIAPMVAKKALTGKGNVDKAAMMAAAAARLGRLVDEHQADALGLWLAAKQLNATKVAA